MSDNDVRVLVVDDHKDAAETLAELLTMNGYVTRTARDGAAALRLVAEFPPHLRAARCADAGDRRTRADAPVARDASRRRRADRCNRRQCRRKPGGSDVRPRGPLPCEADRLATEIRSNLASRRRATLLVAITGWGQEEDKRSAEAARRSRPHDPCFVPLVFMPSCTIWRCIFSVGKVFRAKALTSGSLPELASL